MAKLDALGHVSKQTFKVDEALDVEYCEVVLQPHVVEILLDTLGLMVAEEADSEGFQSSLSGQSLVCEVHVFFDRKRFTCCTD